MEARELEPLRLGARLAIVDRGVEVAELGGGRLDALVVDAHDREQVLRALHIAGLERINELLRVRHQFGGLGLHVGGVAGDSVVERLLLALGHVDCITRDRERGLADALADHAGLADRVVRAGLSHHGEVARRPGRDVLHLGDDAQLVVAQQVELGDPVARVRDRERDVAAAGGVGLYRAPVRGALHGDDRGCAGLRIRHTAGEQGDGCGRGQDEQGVRFTWLLRGLLWWMLLVVERSRDRAVAP